MTLRWCVTATAVAVALVSGCGVPTTGAPVTPAPPAPTTAVPGPDDGPGARPDAAELAEDIGTAADATNEFWARHWSEYFTETYEQPQVVGFYGPPYTEPTCGGERPEPDNAFYCSSGEDFLAWDTGLMAEGAERGDAWVYLIVAHEWGHAVQYRLSRELESESAELQADCLAGASLYGAERDGTMQFEPGDERELTSALSALADETPWTREGDHGDTSERIGAFDQGRDGGVGACLPTS